MTEKELKNNLKEESKGDDDQIFKTKVLPER